MFTRSCYFINSRRWRSCDTDQHTTCHLHREEMDGQNIPPPHWVMATITIPVYLCSCRYPGGLREITAEKVHAKDPTAVSCVILQVVHKRIFYIRMNLGMLQLTFEC